MLRFLFLVTFPLFPSELFFFFFFFSYFLFYYCFFKNKFVGGQKARGGEVEEGEEGEAFGGCPKKKTRGRGSRAKEIL